LPTTISQRRVVGLLNGVDCEIAVAVDGKPSQSGGIQPDLILLDIAIRPAASRCAKRSRDANTRQIMILMVTAERAGHRTGGGRRCNDFSKPSTSWNWSTGGKHAQARYVTDELERLRRHIDSMEEAAAA
jgi:hypothetical protein